MTSKERVKKAVNHQVTDRVPTNFECVGEFMKKMQKHLNYENANQVLDHFDIDVRRIGADYIGPPLPRYEENGCTISTSMWGYKNKTHFTGVETNSITCYYPLDHIGEANETAEYLETYPWPKADWFDYESVKRKCEQNKDRAIIFGHEGPFQIATFLRNMENLFMDMAVNPDFAHKIYNKMVEFELEYYERVLIAADGQIDILRPHDDYGTQISMLFSIDMWREYFKENTKKLADLAHKYGAFYQQHSCGAVGQLIPEFIDCGVDILEPIQKVKGLEPEVIKSLYGDKIAFHGGIDTQGVLPLGTPEEVYAETKKYIEILGKNGGYILMGSQSYEGDVPPENVVALYSANK